MNIFGNIMYKHLSNTNSKGLYYTHTHTHTHTHTDMHICILLANREREMFYLMTHSTHFIYVYIASDIW